MTSSCCTARVPSLTARDGAAVRERSAQLKLLTGIRSTHKEPSLRFGSATELRDPQVGALTAVPHTLHKRRIANRFSIEAEVASGGMGTIFRALDEKTQQLVALKLLRSKPGRESVERFLREGRVMAQLRHCAIVRYIEHGVAEEGNPYLAMEWLNGEDLSYRLQRGSLTASEALLVLRQVAEALAFLHRRGLVHRDVKPANLFLREGRLDQVTLLDFGLARAVVNEQSLTQTGRILGTPSYMSPEQARGARQHLPAVDVFALGCVLYRCLTGIQPFHAEHIPATLTRILFEVPRPMSQLIPGLPTLLDTLVTRMLAKEPAERLANGDELLAALDELGPLQAALAPGEPAEAQLETGIGRSEQRLISMVLVTPSPTSWLEATIQLELPRSDGVDAVDAEKLSNRLKSFGAQVFSLIDGSLVATFCAANSLASDLAALAARCALSIHELAPRACVAVGTSRSELQLHGGLPAGRLFEQFDRLFQISGAKASDAREAILLDEMTANLLDSRFDIECSSSGLRRLKGLHQELDTSRKLLGKTTSCIGRETELSLLRSHLQQCLADPCARAVLVVGAPGIGKSRLRQEFLGGIRARSAQEEEAAQVILVRGDSMAMTSPYGLVRAALQQLCRLEGLTSRSVKLQKLTEKLAAQLPAARIAHVRDVLAELCDLHSDDAPSLLLRRARTDPALMRQEVGAALYEFLCSECASAPVILAIEDMQWADSLSVEVIGSLVQRMDEQPLFVVGFGRPDLRERLPSLWQNLAHDLLLRGLSRKASARLIREVLGDAVSGDVVERMINQAAGNALYLEELIRAYAAAGQESGIPETVLAMIQARLDRLPAEGRRVLRAASVFGQFFWLPAVQQVLGAAQSPVELVRQLDYLVECELCERHATSRSPGSLEYGFCNELLREAVYRLLTDEDRVRGHRLAGQFLAQAGDCEPRIIFDHLKRGGEYEQAVRYGLQAGDDARRLCSQHEARLIYAEVVELTEQLGEEQPHRLLAADALLRFIRCSLSTLALEVSAELLAQVELLLPVRPSWRIHNPSELAHLKGLQAWLHCLKAKVASLKGDSAEVTRHCRLTLSLSQGLGTPELVAFPAMALGITLRTQGYCAQAAVLFKQALAALENLNDLSEQLRAQVCYAACLLGLGEAQAAWKQFREAEQRAQETNQPSVLGAVYHLRAIMHLWLGDWPAALVDSNLAARTATKAGEQVTLAQCTLTSVLAAVQQGDTASARAHIQAVEKMATELGGKMLLGQWLTLAQAELALLEGRPKEGLELARQACEQSSRSDQPYCLGIAERVFARALARLHPNRCAEIDAHMRRSIATLDSAGLMFDVARTRLHWAVLLKQRGELIQANELYVAALARFRMSGCSHALTEAEKLWKAQSAGI